MEPPFFVRKFRPTISEPANPEIDSIRLEQAKGFVENECRVMSLHAKNAQKNNDDVDTQMKALIDSMTEDEKLKDALHRRWNETKIDGETRELKKWQEKEKWFDQLPTNPSLEDKEDSTVQSKKGPTAQSKKGPTGNVTTESHAESHGKKSKPKPPQAQRHKKQKGATASNPNSSRGNANKQNLANKGKGSNPQSAQSDWIEVKRKNKNRKKAQATTTNGKRPLVTNPNNGPVNSSSSSGEQAHNQVFRKKKPHPNRPRNPRQK